ncbi:FIG00824362: hypothetical protein [Sphingobium indicum BiD32]|uniref:Acyl-CoA transferase n=1 Tax=Sphingobium indicum BiD32 TaxID=1301087 RepID=N1MLH4_9SPHN|nr:CoA transferase [Sphingobium indicum]CCW16467.1 FIG00824362: hypothetical protein [Sphingobium indicum BiD32]
MNRAGPLAGIRVLEITKVWAGPYAGKLLAFLGAEVIKVESRANLDEMRAYGGVDIDSAPYFRSINQEVLSVQVDMKSAEGMAYLHRMIALSDVLIDNLRPGAMERSGLSYEAVRAIRPDIIQLSIKMYGSDGPLGYQTGYAPCFAALGGLNALVGHEGETPAGMNIRYGDSTVGASAALAIVAALHHRETTGEGQFIDLSAVETLSTMIGDSLFAHGLTGDLPRAQGNAHAEMAPHGCYPCTDGQWISITVADEVEWTALVATLGAPLLGQDARFADHASRLAHRTALDAAIAAISITHDAEILAETLLLAGVPACKSQSSLDLIGSEALWSLGAYRLVTDARGETRPVIGPGWRMSPDEAPIEKGAPLLGEHNIYVYGDLLGLGERELADLMARKIAY